MSLLRAASSHGQMLEERTALRRGGVRVTHADALRQSVVWAATHLRADLISLMPVDVYRPSAAAGINVPVKPPKVLVEPAEVADGHPMAVNEWLYSGQMSLDRAGNNFGVVRAVDALGLPARIELANPDDVTVRIKGGRIIEYRFGGEKTDARHVWHERQHTIAGLPIGLSPIAYAALSLSAGIAAQQFALDWFQNGAVPGAILKNGDRALDPDEAGLVKRRFKAAMENGDVFVTGKDWTYSAVQAKAAESGFLEQMKYTDQDLCRFMGVPGDMINVEVNSSTINYANVTQRNLQLLVMNLGGAVKRREAALSRLTPGTRYVKLNRAAILAMDEKTRAEVFKARIDARSITPDEIRELEDQLPLTERQYEQFDRLFGARARKTPTNPGGES